MLTALFFRPLWLHYLLEPNVPKSSLMYAPLIVYRDAFLGGSLNLRRGITSWQAAASQLGLPLADDSYLLFV